MGLNLMRLASLNFPSLSSVCRTSTKGYYGAIVLDDASPTIQNTTIEESWTYAIQADLHSFPALTNNTIGDNRFNGLAIKDSSHTLDIDATWNITDTVYYIPDGNSFTIALGNTLTVAPGVIVKFDTAESIFVSGALRVLGTAEDPVYFTSYRDDTIGGDTNGDGASTGSRGDWRRIQFNDTSDDASSLIEYAIIRYGGRDNYGAITLDGASPAIRRTELRESYYAGIRATSSTPALACNDVFNNGSYGIYNATTDTIVNAANHWWGTPSGPYHSVTNPSGVGNAVSDGVEYVPWRLFSCLAPDLEGSKAVDKELAVPGDVLTYTVVLAETNGYPALEASIVEPVPANTNLVTGSVQVEPPGTVVLPPTAGTVEWTGTVAASSSITLMFQVVVEQDLWADTTIVNIATIDDGRGTSFTRAATTTIDAVPPSCTISDPTTGQHIVGTSYPVRGTSFDETSGVSTVEISTRV
jgi:uncharacterized repeat protein (TIGR01451 family)